MMDQPTCRACRGVSGAVVLDLGGQPACDYFPRCEDPGPDPLYPLQMWLCSGCGLAQLAADPTVPQEPRGAEPAALAAQARDAVREVGAAGLLPDGARVAEYGSPHGGSWLGLLAGRGLRPVPDGDEADVLVDCFGLMHAPDQRAALAERAARVAQGGVLLLQYHSLDTIISRGQWNALRHGHYAYYSTTALAAMLAAAGFSIRTAWRFELYGGTILLAARRSPRNALDSCCYQPPEVDSCCYQHVAGGRDAGGRDAGGRDAGGRDAGGRDAGGAGPDGVVRSLLARDAATGVCDPGVLRGLARQARAQAAGLRAWLTAQRAAGRSVLGYGAASRAVALLRLAEVDRTLLPAIVDASSAKHGLRMPGTDIPVVAPSELARRRPDMVLLFLTDLLAEVREEFGEVEASGGQWMDAHLVGSPQAGSPQAGSPQAGSPQAGSPQAGSPQAGSPQAGSPQAGSPQAGSPEAGSPEASSPEASFPHACSPPADGSAGLEQHAQPLDAPAAGGADAADGQSELG